MSDARSSAYIDLDAVRHNAVTLDRAAGQAGLMAVVKADARVEPSCNYGPGSARTQHRVAVIQQGVQTACILVATETFAEEQGPITPCTLGF